MPEENALRPVRAPPLNIDFQNTAPGSKFAQVGKPELAASVEKIVGTREG
jgi:hypothetical protein